MTMIKLATPIDPANHSSQHPNPPHELPIAPIDLFTAPKHNENHRISLGKGERGLGWAEIRLGRERLERERVGVVVGCLRVRVR